MNSATADATRFDLVAANRILAHEGVLDAYGHVSARIPDRPDHFWLSRARAPEIVEDGDLVELDLLGEPTSPQQRALYLERFIHAAIYTARPDVHAICHNHATSVLPFSISLDVPLRPVIHQAAFLDEQVPVWDIADEFGDATDLLVRTMDHARSLARALGPRRVCLMRGHGSVVAADTIRETVANSIFMEKNAHVLLDAARLGGYRALAPGELARRTTSGTGQPALGSDRRDWEVWLRRAGIGTPE